MPTTASSSRATGRGILPVVALTAIVALVAGLGASAMRGAPDSAERLGIAASPSAPPTAAIGDFASGIALGKRAAERPQQSARTTVASPVRQVADGMVIRNGHVSVLVDSIETAIDALRRLAASLGGGIGNMAMNTGRHQVRSATLELKIPAARFDDAMAGMAPLGKVEQSTASTEDVGEEFVDISARVANARRLEERLLALLANRTGKLEDVLAVERELARVRGEIERHEGRIRYLSSRVATSTIVALVHEKAPLVAGTPGTNVIANAFVNMWRNFVALVALAIESLGFLVPVGLIVSLVAWVWKRRRESRVVAAA